MTLSKMNLNASATDSPNPLVTDSAATSLTNVLLMYIGRLICWLIVTFEVGTGCEEYVL